MRTNGRGWSRCGATAGTNTTKMLPLVCILEAGMGSLWHGVGFRQPLASGAPGPGPPACVGLLGSVLRWLAPWKPLGAALSTRATFWSSGKTPPLFLRKLLGFLPLKTAFNIWRWWGRHGDVLGQRGFDVPLGGLHGCHRRSEPQPSADFQPPVRRTNIRITKKLYFRIRD